jgi:hypothetical protein
MVGGGLTLAIIAGIIVAWINVAKSFTQEQATEVGLAVATILVGVVSVMMFVCIFCSTIHPTERFVDVGAQKPEDVLLNGISDAEQKVCELIQRTNKYIESDVGKPGQDDPSLIVAAQRKALIPVPGNRLVDCTASASDPTLADADMRLTLMENSLKWFTGSELEATYKKAMAGCEGFRTIEGFDPAPIVNVDTLQVRLNTIVSEIADQHRQYLDPLDKQQERLQRGEVSECQKKMGANAGADAAAGSKAPPPGTPLS